MMKPAFCALMLIPFALLGSAVPFFDQGKTDWKIVPSSEAESFAAEELSRTLKQVSKADFDRVDAPRRIVLGTPFDCREIAEKFPALAKDPEMDSFAVRLEGDVLYVAGSNARSVLFGVYSLLKKTAGCRWFWPGEEGEFIPELETLNLPEKLDYAETAAFRYRELTEFLNRKDMREWMARVNLNCNSNHLPVEFRQKTGLVSMLGNHVIALHKKDFERDPNLFGMNDGKRELWLASGCWSNPDFLKLMVERNIQLTDERKIDILMPFPADATGRCDCPECIKEPNASNRWQKFFRKFREEFRKQRPHVRFAGLAYQEYRDVPTCDIDGVLFTAYAMYNRCYVHKLNDPTCEMNRKVMEDLRAWKKKGPLGVYGYHYCIFEPRMYVPYWNMLADEARTMKSFGGEYLKTEFGLGGGKKTGSSELTAVEKFRLSAYLYASLSWNPDLDVDAEIADFCRVVYGPAARPMERYHKKMAQCWDAQTEHYSYWANKPEAAAKYFLSPESVAEADALLNEAAKAAAGNPRAEKNVRVDAECFKLWRDAFESARKSHVSFTVPFENPDVMHFVDGKGNPAPSTITIRRSADSLLLRIQAPVAQKETFIEGVKNADAFCWTDDTMEIFLDYGTGYHHFAYNFAGNHYDAKGQDRSWSPKWTSVSRWDGNVWVSDVEIPFDSIGCRPENGKWKIVVTRNGRDGFTGFPVPSVHNTSVGADMIFPAAENGKK